MHTHKHRLLYINLKVTTNPKPITDKHTQKRERNPNVTPKIVIKSQGKRAKEEENKKNYKNKKKTITKMAISISTYLSIINLNINANWSHKK